MGELDDRVVKGLRDFVDRAPVNADVWVETERHVARHQRRRQLIAAAAAVAIVAVATVVGVRSTGTTQRVRVATTTPTTREPTTTTTSSAADSVVDACLVGCIGRVTADVDGDGKPDQIGLMATPPLSGDITANAPSKLTVRVVFADGRTAEYSDTAAWDASLVGAADVNGDGKAEIFYFNDTGASFHRGHILQWDGSQLVVVNESVGKPFTTLIDGYAMGGSGFGCDGNSLIAMSIHFDGAPVGWVGTKTTYQWSGHELVKLAENQPIPIAEPLVGATGDFQVPPEYTQIIGVHCAGLPH